MPADSLQNLDRPLILTAAMDHPTQSYFQKLRDLHFPPERNIVPAHLTLFHHLPPMIEPEVHDVLKMLVATTAPLLAHVASLQFLGRGVAYKIHCPDLHDMRAEMAERWLSMLIPQDKAPMRAHVTVQNKVKPDAAKACLAALQAEFQPRPFHIIGFDLWRYEGGPWSAIRSFRFRGV